MVSVGVELDDGPASVAECGVCRVESGSVSVNGASEFPSEGVVYGVARFPVCKLGSGGGGMGPEVVLSVLALRCHAQELCGVVDPVLVCGLAFPIDVVLVAVGCIT